MSCRPLIAMPSLEPYRTMGRLAAGLMAALFVLSPAHAGSFHSEGEKDAVNYCSACHRVRAGQPQPPAVFNPDEARSIEAPSFDRISRHFAGRSDALTRFIRAPLHPMREQQFLPRDLRAIVRYIVSLRGERWSHG